ncbi:MAG: IS21 family transposase, partial [Candidatus Atribacteria bacterium]|nr:IS21 family transposase [Candidatus Atribacteria bacterium]
MDEIKQKIFYLKDVMNFSFHQIEEELGVSRKYVSKIYNGKDIKKVERKSSLDKYHSLIAGWFSEYPSLKATQVYDWLIERDVAVSYPRVVQYTKHFRRKKEKIYHHLNFLPGEEGQVDWAILPHPKIGRIYCFVLILSYSRYLFAHIFPRYSFEFFIEGHLKAFSFMKGLPHSLRYDNLKSVVLKRKPQIEYNPRFLNFCHHYGIKIRLCNPGAGNEKGRVERAIRTIKESFFNTMINCCSIEALNQSLHQWVDNKNKTIHRSTRQKPIDLIKEEKLKTLPAIAWNNVTIHSPVKTTKTAMMIFDTNSYSVPDYLVGKFISIHSTPTKVSFYNDNKRVAKHPRCFKRFKKIINPLHRSYLHLSTGAKMQRIYEVIKNVHPIMAEFLLKNETCGEDPQKTAYQIFKIFKN